MQYDHCDKKFGNDISFSNHMRWHNPTFLQRFNDKFIFSDILTENKLEKIAYILGVVKSDGHISSQHSIRLITKDGDFAESFKRAFEELLNKNLYPVRMYRGFYFWEICSKKFALFLKSLQIETFLINEKMKGNFLKGFFDGEGSINFSGSGRKVHREISCVNKNETLIHLISNYLTELSIENRIRKILGSGFNPKGIYYLVLVYGKQNILNFYKKIGFSINRKQNKLVSALNSYVERECINPSSSLNRTIHNSELRGGV